MKYRELVGKVVAKILDKKYSDSKRSVSLAELLDWEFWPICITIYRKTSCIQCNTLIESTFYIFATSVCLC